MREVYKGAKRKYYMGFTDRMSLKTIQQLFHCIRQDLIQDVSGEGINSPFTKPTTS